MKLYIARDKDGSLYIYKHKPIKNKKMDIGIQQKIFYLILD